MDFFEHQDRARRNTRLLVVYFTLAVVMVIAAVYVAVLSIIVLATQDSEQPTQFLGWHPTLLVSVGGVVTLIIAIGSLYKIWALGSDGENVALALGGAKVCGNTTNLDERILLNVVEEMALAAGTPVPPVFLMRHEAGINAFAAGTTPQNAVIGVTQGAIRTLNREELQGVIAHEFSHILNGDMRLNLRLMGLLNGILLIALIGYLLLRILGNVGTRSRSEDDKGTLGVVAAIALLGGSLVAIGYIGVFFANIIKAAVSRQREFLADASAVQFTRNPEGISSALKRIGGWQQKSLMASVRAPEASHMFFGEGVVSYLFSTHPALAVRVKRIDPRFDGVFGQTSEVTHTMSELIDPNSLSLVRSTITGVHQAAVAGANLHEQQPQLAVSQIGEPRQEHLVHAQHIIEDFDELLTEDVHDPLGAIAIVYALLLAPAGDPIRARQMQVLSQASDAQLVAELQRVSAKVDALAVEQRLPLACMALPALSHLSPAQVVSFRENVRGLIEADRKCTIFEFAIQRFISKRLVRRLKGTEKAERLTVTKGTLVSSYQVVLSTLAHMGSEPAHVQAAFAAGVRAVPKLTMNFNLMPRDACSLRALDEALDSLERSASTEKRDMLAAFSACIAADGKVEVSELELLRVISDALGCPMPPVIVE